MANQRVVVVVVMAVVMAVVAVWGKGHDCAARNPGQTCLKPAHAVATHH